MSLHHDAGARWPHTPRWMPRWTRMVGVACLASMATTVWAQTAPAPDDPQADHSTVSALPDVRINGRADNAVGTSDAASQGTVAAPLLNSRPARRPGDILEFIPGMVVTQHAGDGKANQYFLRGFNLDHGTDFATWIDGMPANLPTHAHGHGYTDLNFLIPELVNRIDYRKGPYFAGDGDFSSAGSATIHLRNTVDNPFAQVTIGQRGFQRLLTAASPALKNGGSLLMAFEGLANRGPWEVSQDLRKLNAVLRYAQGSRTNGFDLTLMSHRARWTSTDQIPQRAIDSGQVGRFGSLDPTDGGETSRTSVSAQWRRGLSDGAISASAYWIGYGLDLYANFTYALQRPDTGDQFLQKDRRNVMGGDLRRAWHGSLGAQDMVNELGIQLRHDRVQVGLFDSTGRQVIGTVRNDKVNQTSVGVFAQNTVQWQPWLRSITGLRVSQFQWNVASSLAANSGSSSDWVSSPKLTWVFGPWGHTEYFANWGRGFHSNDARGTQTRVDPRTGAPTTPVNGLVRTTGYEIGARSQPLAGLQSSLAIWRLLIGSELVFVGDAGTTEPSRPSQRQGVEWTNRYTPQPWLLFDLDLALSRARFADQGPAGNQIPAAVSRVVSTAVTVRDRGPWSASLQWRYLGARPLNEDGSVLARPMLLTNLRAGYRINRQAEWAIEVFNLFDRKVNDIEYFYASRMPGEAQPVDDRHLHPAEPRTIRLSLRLAF